MRQTKQGGEELLKYGENYNNGDIRKIKESDINPNQYFKKTN